MRPESRDPAAEAVRRALIRAAQAAYEDAGIQGLCEEGRWEAAVSAMRALDLGAVASDIHTSTDPHRPAGE